MNTKELFNNKFLRLQIFWFGLMFGFVYEKDENILNFTFLCFHLEIKMLTWERIYPIIIVFCVLWFIGHYLQDDYFR